MISRYFRFMKGIVRLASLVLLMGPVAASAQAATSDSVTPPGGGTEENPFLISQLGHLVWMGETAGASAGRYYALQNDLDVIKIPIRADGRRELNETFSLVLNNPVGATLVTPRRATITIPAH